MSNLDLISDHSKEKLVTVPRNVLDMVNLKMLFLEGNFLTKLPDDIFWKLPRLMWLDLRNNLLESVPTSIGFHEKLENLLLSNNSLERLPNELGTVPNLKALQVTDNPLIYPERKIVNEGTKAIKNFLKAQYDKSSKEEEEDLSDRITELDENSENGDVFEKSFLKKVEAGDVFPETPKTKENLLSDPEDIRIKKLKKKISDDECINPDLEVKKLLPRGPVKKDDQSIKITHKVSTAGNKIYLKSSFTKPSPKLNQSSGDKKFNNLKDGWLNELRLLLTDQERILQQERNLRAIGNWRLKRKNEPPKEWHGDLAKAPYDTDPRYNRMLTREELAQTLNDFKEKGFTKPGDSSLTTPVELQTMIKHIMEQLKEMDIQCEQTNNFAEMEHAEQQIRTMMDIQKKLMSLKSLNDTTL